MKPKLHRVYELKGELGDHQQLICLSYEDVYKVFLAWQHSNERKKGDTLTIKVDEMTKKEISQLEEF